MTSTEQIAKLHMDFVHVLTLNITFAQLFNEAQVLLEKVDEELAQKLRVLGGERRRKFVVQRKASDITIGVEHSLQEERGKVADIGCQMVNNAPPFTHIHAVETSVGSQPLFNSTTTANNIHEHSFYPRIPPTIAHSQIKSFTQEPFSPINHTNGHFTHPSLMYTGNQATYHPSITPLSAS